ncbi:MAG: hypothetical protein AB1801_23785 [Chloroflexota bacterium]
MFRRISTVVSIVLTVSVSDCTATDIVIPAGWVIPQDAVFNEQWRRDSVQKYLAVDGDFDGNGLADVAMILQKKDGDGIGLFAFMGRSDGSYLAECLFDSTQFLSAIGVPDEVKKSEQEIYRRYWGIRLVETGGYPTACGKGYYECTADEPETLVLRHQAIDFFFYDAGGNQFFFWKEESKKFVSVQMSD